MSITFDEEGARLMGIPVRPLSLAFNLLVAITIVLSIKVIGVILVVALLVLPGLSALQLNLSFKGTTLVAIVFGIIQHDHRYTALSSLQCCNKWSYSLHCSRNFPVVSNLQKTRIKKGELYESIGYTLTLKSSLTTLSTTFVTVLVT